MEEKPVLKSFSPRALVFFILIFLLLINVVVLDVLLFVRKDSSDDALPILSGRTAKNGTFPVVPTLQTCPSSCIEKIDAVAASIPQVVVSVTSTPTSSPTPIQQTTAPSGVKEFFVPLGSGSSTSDDWTDVSGIQVYVDSSQYGKIKSVVFEASLYTPTGNQTASARLYNATDNHPVWFSDVSLDGGTPKLLISAPVALGSGNKLYKVQMKTQLKFKTNLEQSRIHITTY